MQRDMMGQLSPSNVVLRANSERLLDADRNELAQELAG